MSKTKIEWTDRVWNPITGCSPISEGCRNCYAKRMANRLKGKYGYPKNDPFGVTFHPDRLEEPLRWKKPSRIFTCSMGDLFHESIHPEKIELVFESISYCSRDRLGHTFLLLTKRPWVMRRRIEESAVWANDCWDWTESVFLGVSVENQKTADERIPILLQIPAAKRFVSVEPMLDDILFYPSWWFPYPKQLGEIPPSGLDWVICGGETGSGARPLHPDWVRSLRDQCQMAGVPFFFKQWGEWLPVGQSPASEFKPIGKSDAIKRFHLWEDINKNVSMKIGRKAADHLIDSKEWREFPK